MSNPDQINQLIETAAKAAGSEYKLSKAIGITQSQISNWKSGHSKCSPEDAALMAEVAGLNAAEWMARVAIAKHEGTPKGEKLKAALKKALLVTGGVLATSGANAGSLPVMVAVKEFVLNTMYIVVKLKKTNPI